jgi:putative ABC transport system permease protein
VVTPGYFETMGIPLIRGRFFDSRDREDAPLVAIVNPAMARNFWPNQEVVGKQFNLGGPASSAPWIQVVGLVGDVKQMGLGVPSRQEIYFPYMQARDNYMVPRALAVRTSADPMSLVGALRQVVKSIDSEQALNHVRTMDEIVSRELSQSQVQTVLLGGLAGLALVMASVGIYGVITYMVNQRKFEIGVRMAIGAAPRDVLWLILRRGLMVITAGVVLGFAGAISLTGLIRGLLYGVGPTDPGIMASVVVILMIVGIAACVIPARRAASIDPMKTLRTD